MIFGAGSDDARVLWSIVVLLAVVGIALVMVAVAVLRVSRPDRELLAPLEVMGRRKWRRSDPVWQRRQLDAVRPVGAEPLSVSPAVPVPLDEFDEGPEAAGFDDLADVDTGVDDDVVVLPGGVAFDADPTPASGELPVVLRASASDDESTIAQLGVDWSAPDVADRTDLDAPPVLPRRIPRRFPLEPPGLHAAEAAAAGEALQDDGEVDTTAALDEPSGDAAGSDASAPAESPGGPVQMTLGDVLAPPADADRAVDDPAPGGHGATRD